MLSDIISMGTTLLYSAFAPVVLVLVILFVIKKITKKVLWTGIKIAVVVYLAATFAVPFLTGCGSADSGTVDATEAAEVSYSSTITKLGDYEGLTYTDDSDREPTDEEVEEEMQAILLWFDGGELTDEWVTENMHYDSLADFRENTYYNLKAVYEQNAWTAAAQELFETVIGTSEFDLNDEELDAEYAAYEEHYKQLADMGEISLEEFVNSELGVSMETFETNGTYAAEMILKTNLVAEAIIKNEQLDPAASYDTVAGEIAEQEGYDTVAELEEAAGGTAEVMLEVKYHLAADYMMEHGNPQ